jgi:hypothetical protein
MLREKLYEPKTTNNFRVDDTNHKLLSNVNVV